VRYELTGGVHAQGDPTVPGSAPHMRAIRDWIALDDAVLATFDAPLVQVGGIHLPYAPFPLTTQREPGTVFSWAMNNGWDTNFPQSQGGEVELAYAVGGAGPPLTAILSSPRAADGIPERGTLCTLPEGIELIAIGAGRAGGLVAQVRSRAAGPVELDAAFPDLPVTARAVGDHLERPRGGTAILPGELLTIALA
jgi:hypothetical protein